ncbi:thioredoxin-like protein [Coniochaeta ligniaria NRRL 30616]|uniref:Thioredoxin-like protein n=1 Tax=Coniochaeta ligniaria NRRL 30616 TaxID=1408157 RepID=A0A1J7J171_9PEZI|nr:thioredoxin-like protein [Coniochaeta ligniaria NRRL 30616]
MYESQITFTLDTICPWTYLAKRRLDQALSRAQTLPEITDNVVFKPIIIRPYQLYPDFPSEGTDKFAWYRDTKYDGSEERMQMYTDLMSSYGSEAGINFSFRGTISNTLDAHRVIQKVQEEKGPEMAGRVVDALYRGYFEEEKHPASVEVLVAACEEAGIGGEEAKSLVTKGSEDGVRETKRMVLEQKMEGVDSVPTIRIEGRRRDITLVGAKTVDEYGKALMAIAKESR